MPDSNHTRLQIALRAIASCLFYLAAIATFIYVLVLLDQVLLRTNNRGWEWLPTLAVLGLFFLGIGQVYFLLLAIFTAITELLPSGAVKRKLSSDLDEMGTLDAKLARFQSLRSATVRNLLDAPTWAPRLLLSVLKFSALAVAIVVGVVACVSGVASVTSSLAGAPGWAILIIILLVLLLAK